eukprot:1159190-Pelagomonas_calceolata.AAC.11
MHLTPTSQQLRLKLCSACDKAGQCCVPCVLLLNEFGMQKEAAVAVSLAWRYSTTTAQLNERARASTQAHTCAYTHKHTRAHTHTHTHARKHNTHLQVLHCIQKLRGCLWVRCSCAAEPLDAFMRVLSCCPAHPEWATHAPWMHAQSGQHMHLRCIHSAQHLGCMHRVGTHAHTKCATQRCTHKVRNICT